MSCELDEARSIERLSWHSIRYDLALSKPAQRATLVSARRSVLGGAPELPGSRRQGAFATEDELCAIGTLNFQPSCRTSRRFPGERNRGHRVEGMLSCSHSARHR